MAALALLGFGRTLYSKLGRKRGAEKNTVPELLAAVPLTT
jgi:hypothetical protein